MSSQNSVRVYVLGFSQSLNRQNTERLLYLLESNGIIVRASEWIAKGISQNPLTFQNRAEEFSQALAWQADWILDVTGGDGSNGVLDLLDYEAYQNSSAVLAGYSDVSCVLNALAWKTGRPVLLFQASGNLHERALIDLLKKESDLISCPTDLEGDLVYGDDSVLYGGNVRSFLKLAGTPYLPDLTGKPLFLEAYSTSLILFISYLVQLDQMQVLSSCSRLIIGQLTAIDQNMLSRGNPQRIFTILEAYGINLPENTVRTKEVGHSKDSRALWIGGRPEWTKRKKGERHE